MSRPAFKHELASVLHFFNWLCTTIHKLAELRDKFSKAIKLGIKQSKLKRLRIPIGWTDELNDNWERFKKEILKAMKRNLYHYNHELRLSIFTDASDGYWSGFLIQTEVKEDSKQINYRRHLPVILLSGSFMGGQIKWHISQKEIYPILILLKHANNIILGNLTPVKAYTEHRNLIYLIRPNCNKKRSYIGRMSHWESIFQDSNIIFEHIRDEYNILADIISRWGTQNQCDKSGQKESKWKRLADDEIFREQKKLEPELRELKRNESLITISANVYSVRSLLGDEKIVHASRLWWYEGPSYKPAPEAISHFRLDYGVLEVDEIKDIKLTSEGYFLLVSWLGFKRHEDTLEPLEILDVDVKDTVENFLLMDGDYKKALRNASIEVAKSTWREDEVILRLDAVEFLARTPSLSQKWIPVEKDIIWQYIQVFGVGSHAKIHSGNYLPYKTTQQLYTQTQ
eukprot:augustus_masked-scaffold_8-processed-gene-3.2-mRNA-1 protein AED:1.00 eAED:1.00 QI:0/0/0/0/1/1/4/0/455